MTGQIALPIHADLAPLAMLVGRWRGEGRGTYPTVDDFEYREETSFGHVGKPFLSYTQRTWLKAGGEPSHTEAGYWRPTSTGGVEVVLAHPSGIVELQEGTVSGGHIALASRLVAVTVTAKEVTDVHRVVDVDGDVLRYRLDMAAAGERLRTHLEAELRRV